MRRPRPAPADPESLDARRARRLPVLLAILAATDDELSTGLTVRSDAAKTPAKQRSERRDCPHQSPRRRA